MIDVIFLLLTFFVHSMVMRVRADVLPVKLAPLTTGEQARDSQITAVTVDKTGALFLNRERMSMDQLDARLREIAKQPNPPAVYLALEAEGSTDRAPVLLAMIERVRAAGIQNFVLVGPPSEKTKTPPVSPETPKSQP